MCAVQLELRPQIREIINLPIERNAVTSGLLGHGLPAEFGEINDRQAAMPHSKPSIVAYIHPAVVGAPVCHRVTGRLESFFRNALAAGVVENSDDAAHA